MTFQQTTLGKLALAAAGCMAVLQAHGQDVAVPILSAPADQVIAAGHAVEYSYAIVAPFEGVHHYRLAGKLVIDNVVDLSPVIHFSSAGSLVNVLTLGGARVVEAAAVGARSVRLQSDGVAGGGVSHIGSGDVLVIGGQDYTVLSLVDDGGMATLMLEKPLANPLAAGDLLAEKQQFTATIPSVGQVKSAGQAASISMSISATDAGNPQVFASDSTFTSVVEVGLAKYVRNVTRPNGQGDATTIAGVAFYAAPGAVVADSGEVLEYALVIEAGASAFEGVELTEAVPPYTVYVPSSTTMNGRNVPDVKGQSPLAGGLLLSTGAAATGALAPHDRFVVTYQAVVE